MRPDLDRPVRAARAPTGMIIAVVVVVMGVTIAVAGPLRARDTAVGAKPRPPADWAQLSPTAAGCEEPTDCAISSGLVAAAALVASKPGRLGAAVKDRVTGAVWRAGTPDHPVWTASTIKLAIAADLLERARVGRITLDTTARKQIVDMLDFSSNSAADQLWKRFRVAERVPHFRTVFGMSGLAFPTNRHYWGTMKCTTDDLLALMSYVLDRLAPPDRDFIVDEMRTVAAIQRWGVWAAGPAMAPGVKGGWSIEPDPGGEHWVANSVGFAGPDARYAVALMYELPPGVNAKNGSVDAGVQSVSDVVATVFGSPVPAPVTIPREG